MNPPPNRPRSISESDGGGPEGSPAGKRQERTSIRGADGGEPFKGSPAGKRKERTSISGADGGESVEGSPAGKRQERTSIRGADGGESVEGSPAGKRQERTSISGADGGESVEGSPAGKRQERTSISESDGGGLSEGPSAGEERRGTPRLTPAFWDSLSSIHLTRRALAELDRRNALRKKSSPKQPTSVKSVSEPDTIDLEDVARRGGPDLTDLRGCPYPMSPSNAGGKRTFIPVGDDSCHRSEDPYDTNFQQYFIDRGIYPPGAGPWYDNIPEPEPGNLHEILNTLLQPRASPSEQSPDDPFRDFMGHLAKARDQAKVGAEWLCAGAGEALPNPFNNADRLFNYLEPLDKYLPPAQPDFYVDAQRSFIPYGLRSHTFPCLDMSLIAAPNFFVEATCLFSCSNIGTLHACYDGALGARAMHYLQNYRLREANYDGNAYSFSSTWYDRVLTLFSHHVSPPAAPGQSERYHMTCLAQYDMASGLDAFKEGVTAFCNLRDLAESVRANFLEEVKQRVPPGHQ
ncbi:hypothetical protein AYL99_11840 [Fonsecaea erecta]|uniref:Uncharacterized protein n=1 Tax=Fonsecaea erecta TaxID=1367422 RepID=A0A178Z2G7_9EURO|nr:hypothetical protein AYL99_11840 [Fonsecaea erecta]OAP53960.1 hypothetical protein AYL99_11840 [Fonsecaea erecta]